MKDRAFGLPPPPSETCGVPYHIVGAYVVNKETGERKNKRPMPRARLKKYMRALYAREHDKKK